MDMKTNTLFRWTMPVLLFCNVALSYEKSDIDKLKNDKEVISIHIKKNEKENLLKKYANEEFNSNLKSIFASTLLKFLNESGQCELDLISRFHAALISAKIDSNKELRDEYFKLLRATDNIDDIFYKLLLGSNKDYTELHQIDDEFADRKKEKRIPIIFDHKDLLAKNDVKNIFTGFQTWPDDNASCTYQEFNNVKNKIIKIKEKKNKDYFKFLTKVAYNDKVISYATMKKLNYLDESGSFKDRDNSLNSYLEIIFKAKNSMVPKHSAGNPAKLDNLDQFSTERVRRFSKLTRRAVLYRKYSETQIIMLAKVLRASSRRMNVDPDVAAKLPYISQEFTTTNDQGEQVTYVERTEIDPQSQFNLARRLMRRDILNLQTMEIFQKTKITYEDIVMAALETGYISLDDIAFVVQYDDLWNPTKTRYDRVSGFVFKFVGYATFFLPPPWNVFTSLAIGIVGGVIEKRKTSGAQNDNPATFIE